MKKRNILSRALRNKEDEIQINKVIRNMLIPMLVGAFSVNVWRIFDIHWLWTIPVLISASLCWMLLDSIFEVFIWQDYLGHDRNY